MDAVDLLLQQHQEMERLLARALEAEEPAERKTRLVRIADLLPLDASEQTFEPKFKVLKEQTEHHHKEEEEHLFPKVKKVLDADQRRALGEEMLALQRRLDRSGEPRELVNSETDAAAPLK